MGNCFVIAAKSHKSQYKQDKKTQGGMQKTKNNKTRVK